jgi:hypothetical protein
MFRLSGVTLFYSFVLALFEVSACVDGFVLSHFSSSQGRTDTGHEGVCSRTRPSCAPRMQAEWFNVKALQGLQQKIQQKKAEAVDTGPNVILGEAPWGRYAERHMPIQTYVPAVIPLPTRFSLSKVLGIERGGLRKGQGRRPAVQPGLPPNLSPAPHPLACARPAPAVLRPRP